MLGYVEKFKLNLQYQPSLMLNILHCYKRHTTTPLLKTTYEERTKAWMNAQKFLQLYSAKRQRWIAHEPGMLELRIGWTKVSRQPLLLKTFSFYADHEGVSPNNQASHLFVF